jgi:thymidine kinase
MFSGKTELLIWRLRRARIAKQSIAVFKPHIDTRFVGLGSHSKQEFPATAIPVDDPARILALVGSARVVGIEEAQFFTGPLIETIQALVQLEKRVLVAGLDMDAWGKPFGQMPQVMALAEQIDKLTAICMVCGEDATRSQKMVATGGMVDVGAADKYEARCRVHFTMP